MEQQELYLLLVWNNGTERWRISLLNHAIDSNIHTFKDEETVMHHIKYFGQFPIESLVLVILLRKKMTWKRILDMLEVQT